MKKKVLSTSIAAVAPRALRPKRDTVNPCQICGWAEHMAIHQPMTSGPRAGEPFGHRYVPFVRLQTKGVA